MIGALNKLLLVLPANTYRAKRFIQAAATLGIELTIATDSDFSPPDPVGAVLHRIDFCDPRAAGEELAKLAIQRGIASALAVDESGVEVAAWTNAALTGATSNLDGVLATRDKARLRAILSATGIAQPIFIEVNTASEAASSSSWMRYPVVVKPTKGSGSLGVTLAKDLAQLESGLDIARTVMEKMGFVGHRILVEEFIEGPEYAVEVLVVGSKAKILTIFEKPDPLVGPTFAETIYLTPARIQRSVAVAIQECVDAVALALDICNGPMHIEMRVTPEGACYPIDVASRSIGGRCSDALSFTMSATLEELILTNAVSGSLPDVAREHQASGVFMIPVESEGWLSSVSGIKAAEDVPFVQGVDISVAVGTRVTPLPWDNQYLGFIFAKAPGPAAVEKALRTARSLIGIAIERYPLAES